MRLVFLGAGEFGLPTLEYLAKHHQVVAVVSQPDRPAGRKQVLTPTPVSAWALTHEVPLLRFEDANAPEAVAQITAFAPEAAVVIAFGQKLSPALIGALGALAVNLHSSLLPKYRGAAPIHWSLISGDEETGVSVIGLAQKMDAGGVYAQAALKIDPGETTGELHDRLAALGPAAVAGVLRQLQVGALAPLPQDESRATRARKFVKGDGTVDFNQPANLVRARINGLTPWPGCKVAWQRAGETAVRELFLRRVVVAAEKAGTPDLHSRALSASSGDPGCGLREPPSLRSGLVSAIPGTVLENFHVACADGVVELLELQIPGGKLLSAADFARGQGGPSAGDHLTAWKD